jgi:hypothetical protein
MKKLIPLLLLSLPLQATLFLKDSLHQANKGDYVITKQGKTITAMLIYDKTPTTLTIEEISIPSSNLNHTPFRQWLESGAKGYTSWIRTQIDPKTGSILKTSSPSKDTPQHFLSTLINLPFEEIPLNQRKLKGNARKTTTPKETDLFQPQLILDGKEIKNALFNAYKATWPQDSIEELSNKEIMIYLPKDPQYLNYFPYWIQVAGQIEKAKIRVCDSGKNLTPPQP